MADETDSPRGRARNTQLEAPAWLTEFAARDDPPTEIEPQMLARFARAGVVDLAPSDGDTILEVADAARATAVAARGPGFAIAESFEGEPAPVTAALERLCEYIECFDRLRRLRLAAIDMGLVASTARALAHRGGPARLFERVLETGLIVTYARPYLASNRAGLGRRWRPESADDRALHDRIIDELRDPYHAHADRTPHRTITDTTECLGLDGPPIFAEAWWRLTDDELTQIAELADRQAARFDAAARELGAELGERRDPPDDGGWNV